MADVEIGLNKNMTLLKPSDDKKKSADGVKVMLVEDIDWYDNTD